MKMLRRGWATGRRYMDNPLLRRLIGNAGWLLADRIGRLGLGIVILGWTARYLGPAQFGVLNYAQAVVVMVTAIAQFGLTDVVIRDIVRHPDRRDVILSTSFALRVMMGMAAVGMSCLVVTLLAPFDHRTLLITFALSMSLVFQATEVLEWDLQARNSVVPSVAARSSAFFLCLIAKIVAILTGADLWFFAVIVTVEAGLAALFFLFANREGRRLMTPRAVSLHEARYLVRQAAPLFLRTAAIAFYMRLDQILLAQFHGEAAVGIYAAAVRLGEVWFFVPVAMMTALVPTLAGSFVEDQDRYLRHLKQAMRILVYASAGFALVVTVFAGPLITILYGPTYHDAVAILRIYVWASVFGTLGLATSAWFVNSGLTRYALYQALIGLACNAAFNFGLISTLGGIGAAIAYLLTQIAVNYLLNAMFGATRRIFRLQSEVLTLR